MSAVVTFGEIMLRLTTPGHQRFAQATHFEVTPGGAEANVAVLIARLGGMAEFVTRLPAHDLGDRAVDELRRHGVGTSHIARGGDRIGLYFLEQGASQRPGKVIYDRANSALANASQRDFDWDAIFSGKQWFHWSGITPALSRGAARISEQACKAARRHGLTISFDMNYRAKLWSTKAAGAALRPLMKHVDLCVAGAGEARAILGAKGATDEAIATDLAKRFGFRTVAMTSRRGDTASATDWGAMLFTKGKVWHSSRHQITIVDRVGSGDAFTGALIFSLLRGDAPQTALDFAVAASALKHTIPGDYALVSLAEVEALASGEQGGRVQR
jgi:2-dehydro-3-deoxygluconokinase